MTAVQEKTGADRGADRAEKDVRASVEKDLAAEEARAGNVRQGRSEVEKDGAATGADAPKEGAMGEVRGQAARAAKGANNARLQRRCRTWR